MNSFKVFSFVILSLLLWGCSNSSNPAATTSDQKPSPPTSLTQTQQRYEAALAGVVQICRFNDPYFFQTNESCIEGSYPTLLSEQIVYIEDTYIPAAEAYILLLEEAQSSSQIQVKQKNHLLKTLAQLKSSQSTIFTELSAKSAELNAANKTVQTLLADLLVLGCRHESMEFNCDSLSKGPINNGATLLKVQNKMYQATQALEKINKIYESLSNSNIQDFYIKQILLTSVKTENKELIQTIISLQIHPIEDLIVKIEEKAKSYFDNFQMNAVSESEYQFFLILPNKEQLSGEDLKIFSNKYSRLQNVLDFLTLEESLIRSKLVNYLIFENDATYTKYGSEVYDRHPTGSEFKVILPLNANKQVWVNYFKTLDENANNPLLAERQEKIDKIQSLRLNIKKAEQRNPFPVILDLPSQALEGFTLSKSLEIYLAIDQFITDDIPTFLNQKIHKNLTGNEKIKIQYLSEFSVLPKSSNELLILPLKEGYFGMNSSDYLKTQMTIEILSWLEDFKK